MKGNEGNAQCRDPLRMRGFWLSYPPQSKVFETLEELMPWETTHAVLTAKELAAINMDTARRSLGMG